MVERSSLWVSYVCSLCCPFSCGPLSYSKIVWWFSQMISVVWRHYNLNGHESNVWKRYSKIECYVNTSSLYFRLENKYRSVKPSDAGKMVLVFHYQHGCFLISFIEQIIASPTFESFFYNQHWFLRLFWHRCFDPFVVVRKSNVQITFAPPPQKSHEHPLIYGKLSISFTFVLARGWRWISRHLGSLTYAHPTFTHPGGQALRPPLTHYKKSD